MTSFARQMKRRQRLLPKAKARAAIRELREIVRLAHANGGSTVLENGDVFTIDYRSQEVVCECDGNTHRLSLAGLGVIDA